MGATTPPASGGHDELAHTSHGRPARLNVEPWPRVLAGLKEGALQAGLETDRWTLRRIRAVMRVACGVRDQAHDLARRLKALGWSPQPPAV